MDQPRFRFLSSSHPEVPVLVDGAECRLPVGIMLAAALMGVRGPAFSGSALAGAPRGPFCLMGSCFQCVAEVDGVPHQRTCRLTVRPGMRVRLRAAGRDDPMPAPGSAEDPGA